MVPMLETEPTVEVRLDPVIAIETIPQDLPLPRLVLPLPLLVSKPSIRIGKRQEKKKVIK